MKGPQVICRMRKSGVAFTLVEVLVVTAILAIFCALLFPAMESVRQQAQRTKAVSNLRQIGQSTYLYAAEAGVFPGPLWPGQMPQLDPLRSGRLVREIAPYLGITIPATPQIVGLFVPPGYARAPGAPTLENARTFVLNMAVSVNGVVVNPWGSLADATPGVPQRPTSVPGSAWAMSDADQLHPRVKTAAWKTNTPLAPIHSPRRLALYFDGRVAGVAEDLLAVP
ncbi:MAG: type II secretion system protein [Terrimicrobiaceae bacterium]